MDKNEIARHANELDARQRLCTLQHELIHARYHDIG